MLKGYILAVLLLLATAASAQSDGDQLTALINAYRATPGICQDTPVESMQALTPQARLASVRFKPGLILSAALEDAGYANSKADAISVSGASTLKMAFEIIRKAYCRTLLNATYTDIGSSRDGADWTVVLARPAKPLPSLTFPLWQDAGAAILDGVNAARAAGQVCGDKSFAPAPPLRWNANLGNAALDHSSDMAGKRYFNHVDKDGGNVGDRARHAGYSWSRVAENIAFGSHTPQETVEGWLASPGHCANIMNSDFTEMGAAYAVTTELRTSAIYWTQTFGKPRR